MDVFLISPLLKEFRKKVDGEMNRPTKLFFYLTPFIFALGLVSILTLDGQLFRVTILAFSIFLGFSLNLFVLLVNADSNSERTDSEDVKKVLRVLRVFTLFEVFVSLLVVIISLAGYYFSYKLSQKIPLCTLTYGQISSFLVFYLIVLFILIMLKVLRDSAILISEDYLG
jgi:uncharacterized membrane protein